MWDTFLLLLDSVVVHHMRECLRIEVSDKIDVGLGHIVFTSLLKLVPEVDYVGVCKAL